MSAFDFMWHLGNLFAVSLLFGTTVAVGAKLIWRRALAPMGWWHLAATTSASAALVTVTGLVIFGRDGRMATYALMVLVAALLLGWLGFGRRS